MAGHQAHLENPSLRRVRANSRLVRLGAWLCGLFVASWVLLSGSNAWAAVAAPMCASNASSVEAPDFTPLANTGEIVAPCSEELMQLVGFTDPPDSTHSAWLVSSAKSATLAEFPQLQLRELPQLLVLPTKAQVTAPGEPSSIYRPPRAAR